MYTATFGIHQYDLDAFGELRASTYARLLQQAATEASADAGYPDDWYKRAGTLWLVRRTTIEYVRPVRASDRIRVHTWVADFRRVRSQREYELYVAEQDAPVARAHTDWVYAERQHGRPCRIPPDMMESFMPDGLEPALPREPWPDGGPPPDAFSTIRAVEFRDLDMLAHVNNATYLDYLEEAAIGALGAVGWPPERVLGLGGCWRPRTHDIEYLAEAVYGDRLRCLTWVTAQAGSEVERQSEFRHAASDVLLARARSRWGWVSRATRQPAQVPAELARIIHEFSAASATCTPSRAVLARRSSTYCPVCLRRFSLRAARSAAQLALSRRRTHE
jgi:acyl-CoA thioester hydrolase